MSMSFQIKCPNCNQNVVFEGEKKYITVMRRWDNPIIVITVNNDQIDLSMGLDDFVNALKCQLQVNHAALDKAVERIVSEIKQESAKVV